MRGAAVNVKKVALELGGKSPNIVFADADFETAVDNALTAAFVHSGQVCSAGCRAIVEDPIHDRFVAALGERADRIRLGHGTDDATEAGALISAEHRAKVEGVCRRCPRGGRARGRRRPTADEPELQAGFFYRPTVIADVRRDMRIVREEVFGPVLTVERFDDRGRGDRARQRHRLRPGRRGLDGRRRGAQRVAGRLRAGTVWINDYNVYMPAGRVGRLQAVGHRPRARARAVSTSTARPSTSGRTPPPARAAGSRARALQARRLGAARRCRLATLFLGPA